MKTTIKPAIIIIVLMTLFMVSDPVLGQNVLITGWGNLGFPKQTEMETHISSLGFTISSSNTFPADLNNVDILILLGGGSADEDIPETTVDNFISSGGSLCIFEGAVLGGDFSVTAASNPVASFSNWILRSGSQVWTASDPLCVGLDAHQTFQGYGNDVVLKNGAEVVMKWNDGAAFTVTYSYGSGKIVYVNDLWVWYGNGGYWNGDLKNGKQLMENILAWLTPPISFPPYLAVMNGYHNAVPLAWSPPADLNGFQGYNVHRYSMGGAYTLLAGNIQRQYFRDGTAVNGTSYYYGVTALYSWGETPMSGAIMGTPLQNGNTLINGAAISAPSLNGAIQSSEWSAAGHIDISPAGSPNSAELWAMNDERHLYIAVSNTADNTLDTYDGIGIIFDRNHNREWPSVYNGTEGILQIYWNGSTAESRFQGFFGTWPDQVSGGEYITNPDGVVAAIDIASGQVQFEVRLDLTSGPMQVQGGSTAGIFFYALDAGGAGFTGVWPQETYEKLTPLAGGNAWAHGAFSYGDMRLSNYNDVADPVSDYPESLTLSQNYPNPFNPRTSLSFTLGKQADISLSVYSLDGRQIRTLARGMERAGTHTVTWDGTDSSGRQAASGIYLARLQSGNDVRTIRMLLIR